MAGKLTLSNRLISDNITRLSHDLLSVLPDPDNYTIANKSQEAAKNNLNKTYYKLISNFTQVKGR